MILQLCHFVGHFHCSGVIWHQYKGDEKIISTKDLEKDTLLYKRQLGALVALVGHSLVVAVFGFTGM